MERISEYIEREVTVGTDGVQLKGNLTLPTRREGIVLFAHGSGSSRHSPRNRYVAQLLNDSGFGTLLIDLLTPEEEQIDRVTAQHRFDIDLLARRLVGIVDWLSTTPETAPDPIGCFGASTGAAAALIAASMRPDLVKAVVSRGGRPDLAGRHLRAVMCPTLLIVGGNDQPVIPLNQQALEQITAPEKRLEIVPGATHLFEERGALDEVARLAGAWFARYIGSQVGQAAA
jgi:putative phosphoribosyl transferase